jgi:hypothetical protein
MQQSKQPQHRIEQEVEQRVDNQANALECSWLLVWQVCALQLLASLCENK